MSDDHHQAGHDSAEALTAYLVRVDMQLARAGLDLSARDSVCRQVIEQFHDLLPVPLEHASAAQTEAALTKLSSDAAFESDDVVSRGQVLRMLWHRLWIDTPIPLVLNDRGKKIIMWAELAKRLGWMYASFMSVTLILNLMLMGKLTAGWFLFVTIFTVMFPLMISLKLLRAPVESLPLLEHWPISRVERHRFTGMLIIIGSFVFISALFPGMYCLVAIISQQAIWPVNQALFLAVMHSLAGLGFLLVFLDLWRKWQRRRQFKRWAEGLVT